jgi:carbon-monoxide dehydrogenase medium subunit
MPITQYSSPTSIAEALHTLAGAGGARPLAGGTDLLVQARLGLGATEHAVDLKSIPELMTLTLDDAGLRLGAAVPAAQITGHAGIGQWFPGFQEAVGLIGSSQVQGRCSAGGNLCNASPAADSVPALIANRGVCHITGPTGNRTVAAEDFTTGPGSHCLAPGEILVALELPAPPPRTADAYLRLIPRTEMDIAVAGAGVSITLDENGVCSAARVCIGAVAPTARLVPDAAAALVGSTLDEQSLRAAGDAASAAASPISDKRGTADYRRKVVGVLVRRAAAIARSRIEWTE